MKKSYIAVIDSGIGGISTLKALKKSIRDVNYLYFGDNHNAPYGNKSKRRLYSILLDNLLLLKNFSLEALVIGCNTLSVNFQKEIEDFMGVKTFGVFPPVEYCLSKWGKTLLLSTSLTASRYKNIKNLTSIGLKDLAFEIEKNAFDLNRISFSFNLNSEIKKEGLNIDISSFKSVILGCTHYELIKNQISDHFDHQNVIGGNFFTTKAVKSFLKNHKSLDKIKGNEVLFIGKNSSFNREFFLKSGQ